MSSRAANSTRVRFNQSNGTSTGNNNSDAKSRGPVLSVLDEADLLPAESLPETVAHLPTDLADWLHQDKKEARD